MFLSRFSIDQQGHLNLHIGQVVAMLMLGILITHHQSCSTIFSLYDHCCSLFNFFLVLFGHSQHLVRVPNLFFSFFT